jgi:hypothetical protein
MADLIVVVGPPASGKAAVGHELTKFTGFRFFHNHMTAEPLAALFGWGAERFGEALAEVRLRAAAFCRLWSEYSRPSPGRPCRLDQWTLLSPCG